MEEVFDPLRRTLVVLTPEEKVRQWFIGVLRDSLGVPVPLMNSEVGFKLGTKPYRADILVWDRSGNRLAVVECKRPSVTIDAAVLDQAIRYNMALDVRWIFLTNGTSTFVLQKKDGKFVAGNELPTYERMLAE